MMIPPTSTEIASPGLCTQDYYFIDWTGQGNDVCEVDSYPPRSALDVILARYEKYPVLPLRRAASRESTTSSLSRMATPNIETWILSTNR